MTNAVNSFYFKPMLNATAAIGPGYKGPTYYQLRVNLLKDAKKEVQLLVDSYSEAWAKVGCTIMGDGWTDNVTPILKHISFKPFQICESIFVHYGRPINI